MTKMLEGSKNLTYAATTVTVRGELNAASEAQLTALADELSRYPSFPLNCKPRLTARLSRREAGSFCGQGERRTTTKQLKICA